MPVSDHPLLHYTVFLAISGAGVSAFGKSTAMLPSWSSSSLPALAPLILFALLACTAHGDHLSVSYYDKTCPSVQDIVQSVLASKVAADQAMAPAVLRLFFHDCFVNVSNLHPIFPLPSPSNYELHVNFVVRE